MKQYMGEIEHAYVDPHASNSKLIVALELEDFVSDMQDELVNGLFPEIEESVIKKYLPSIYQFEKHHEWNIKEESVIDERLKKVTYLFYVYKGYQNEMLIDSNKRIHNLLKSIDKQEGYSVEQIQDLYFQVYKKLVMYSEHLNGILISVLAETLTNINDYDYCIYADNYIECVLFIYGLYVEILEIYDPHKLEVSPF